MAAGARGGPQAGDGGGCLALTVPAPARAAGPPISRGLRPMPHFAASFACTRGEETRRAIGRPGDGLQRPPRRASDTTQDAQRRQGGAAPRTTPTRGHPPHLPQQRRAPLGWA